MQYDKTMKIGNTTINFVAPQISDEENERRWKIAIDIAKTIVINMIERGEWKEEYNDK